MSSVAASPGPGPDGAGADEARYRLHAGVVKRAGGTAFPSTSGGKEPQLGLSKANRSYSNPTAKRLKEAFHMRIRLR
jgi:hypothetical protein